MTMRAVERPTTEERVSFLEGAYDHLPTKSDVFGVEKQLSDRITGARGETASLRTELLERIAGAQTELSDRITEARTESRNENAKLRTEMREGFAKLHTKIAESEAKMAKMNADAQARTTRLVVAVCTLSVAIATVLNIVFG